MENISFPKNKTALVLAENFIMKNRLAYCRCKDQWNSGKYNDKSYNNVSYVQENDLYFMVFRLFRYGTIYLVGYEEISKSKYDSITAYLNTYCNFAINIFWNYFINNSEYSKSNLQYFNGYEKSANAQIKLFESGDYNNNEFGFKEVDQNTALNISMEGGLSIATLNAKIGHVATLTGNIIDAQPEICQSGLYTGIMSISKGFGISNMKKIKYYSWIKL